MKKLAFAAIGLLAITMFEACKNDHEETPPVITINAPIEDTEYEQNDTVFFTGNITHSVDLHEYMIEMKDVDHDTVLYTSTTHTHGTSADFNEYWVNHVADHTQMLLTVTAEDHDGNKSSKVVHFHCHPL